MENATDVYVNIYDLISSPNLTNEESKCIKNSGHSSCIVQVCVRGFISLFCLICNSFALLVLHRIHDMHHVTKLLVVALTISDLGVGFFGLLTASLKLYSDAWYITENVTQYFQLVGLCILVMITVVRYIAVSQPLRLETLVTTRRAYTGLTCATLGWLAFFICDQITPLMQQKSHLLEDLLSTCFICFLGFLLVSVIILYVKLLLIARHQARRIAAAEVNAEDAQDQLHRSNIRSLKTFLIITATVCITWLPSLLILTLPLNQNVHTLFESLRNSNSWLNTVIYSWRNETFRKVAKKLISRKGRK